MTDASTAVMPKLNLRNYAIAFVGTVLGLAVAGFALGYIGVHIPTGMNTWLPAAVAALLAGQAIARDTGAPASSGLYWRLGVSATACAVVVHLIVATVVFTGLSVMTGVNMLSQIAAMGPLGLAIVGAVMIAAIYVCNVCFLWLGVKNGLKAQAKKADNQ
ncbi:MAG: ABZJ_00895 family protein [Shimia sp.]|jgi:hypothetical protein|uniref:ABZJ_00895 family protein n=1 Tax=Shimia sp. TaxID=1954381 RepID=UPI004059B2BE